MNLKLVTHPDPILRQVCAKISEVNEEIQDLAWAMKDLMLQERGIGLAANQIGRAIQLFVVDIWWTETGVTDNTLYFINPILIPSLKKEKRREGCLSLPGVSEQIERAESIKVRALGIDGEPFELEAGGLLSVAIQHEYDHLLGLTMLDRMGPTTRRLAEKRIRKS